METEHRQTDELSMYDRNMLQHDAAVVISDALGISVEDILLEHSADFRELIASDPDISTRQAEDRPALVHRLAEFVIEQHKRRHAA